MPRKAKKITSSDKDRARILHYWLNKLKAEKKVSAQKIADRLGVTKDFLSKYRHAKSIPDNKIQFYDDFAEIVMSHGYKNIHPEFGLPELVKRKEKQPDYEKTVIELFAEWLKESAEKGDYKEKVKHVVRMELFFPDFINWQETKKTSLNRDKNKRREKNDK